MSRIAIVTPTYPPYRGGIGKVAAQDAAQLSSLGHDVTVFAPSQKGTAGIPEGEDVRFLGAVVRYGNAAFLPRLAREVRGYDVVVLQYPFFGGAEPVAFSGLRRRGQKLVITYHMDVVGSGPLRAFFRLHGLLARPWILGRADRIAVTSFDYAGSSAIGARFRRDPSSFRELPPSVDVDAFSPGEPSAPVVRKYGRGAPTALFVGGLDKAHYFKGVPLLLSAFARKELAGARLIIVGDGDLRPGFEAAAKRLKLGDRVVFAGGVADDELCELHRLADVFAFPSTDRSEAFGIAALEAASSGTPVVASDLAGVRTIVRDGETGHLIRPGSVSALTARLADLFRDEEKRRRFGDAGRRMAVTEYSDASRRERWRRLIEGLL